MPYTITIETYHEFSARHSGQVQLDGQSVSTGPLAVGGELLFPDGARCSKQDGDLRQEPPRDPYENLRRRLAYWREAVARSEKDFHAHRAEVLRLTQLAARYSNLPGPTHANLEYLGAIQRAVFHAREQVAELQRELAATRAADPEAQRRIDAERFRAQYEQEDRARAAEVMGRVAAVNI